MVLFQAGDVLLEFVCRLKTRVDHCGDFYHHLNDLSVQKHIQRNVASLSF